MAKMELKVHCKTPVDDLGMDTLIGDYTELGSNHGRKTFQRKEASDDGDVFLYYWDARDGADQSGWWFGDSVGGSQVWARCQSSGALPPTTGWRVPWDGDVQDALCIEQKGRPPVAKGKATPTPKMSPFPKSPAKSPPPSPPADDDDVIENGSTESAQELLQKVTDKIKTVESEAIQGLAEAKAMLEGDIDEDAVRPDVEALLQKHQQACTDCQKTATADMAAIRRKDPKMNPQITQLTSKIRGITMRVTTENGNLKKTFEKKKKEAEDQKKRAKFEEMQLQAEQRDAQILEEALPAAIDIVTQAEDLFEQVVTAAAPLENGLEEDMVEEANRVIKETEQAVSKATAAVTTAKKELMTKMAAASKFAPEAQKVAIAEYTALNEKVAEVTRKLGDYKSVKKDWEQKHEARRIMDEVTNKLGVAEAEVEKLLGMLPDGKAQTEEEIKNIEGSMRPVLDGVLAAIKFVDQKALAASGALKKDLADMQGRGKELKSKLEAFRLKLTHAKSKIQYDVLVQQSSEKTKLAEDAVEDMRKAEEPIIKSGMEALPDEEAAECIKACEEAAKKAETVTNSSKAFHKTKTNEMKRIGTEAARKASMEDMDKLQGRLDYATQKINEFKKETSVRKTSVMLKEVTAAATDAESKLQAVVEAAKPLHADNLEEVSLESLKQATEQTLECEKAAGLVCAEVRKIFAAKSKESPGKDAVTYTAELQKLNARVSTVQQELAKERKVALVAEKLYKVRQTVTDKEKEMDEIEAELEKVEILTTPVGDERPSDEAVKEMDIAVTAVQKSLSDCKSACVTASQSAQGVHKESLNKLLVRIAEGQTQLDEMKATTRELIERLQCDQIIAEAQSKLDKVEEAFQKCDEAEAPYLKGLDALPTAEGSKAVADSEAAIALVQQAISDAKTFVSSKSLDIRKFVADISKPGLVKVAEFTSKNEENTKRLAEFKKETESRKRAAQLLEGSAKVEAVDEAVKAVTEAAAPLTADTAEEVANEAAQEICEKMGVIEKAAQEKLDEAKKFLTERQKEMKEPADRAEISKCLSRLTSIQADLAKARASAANAEQKIVAKLLMGEVSDLMKALEDQVEKVSAEAAPLTEEGGREFLVASMTKMFVDALSEYIGQNGSTFADLYKQMNSGDGKATEAEFIKFFEKVPELCSRPDLAFSSEQLGAIFEQIDEDDDGALTQEDFLDMFVERFICVSSVSFTDVFDIQADDCQTISKLEEGDLLEALCKPKMHESLGLARMQVKLIKTGASGWITLQGNQGKAYVEPFTAFVAFMRGFENMMAEAMACSSKASAFLNQKSIELKDIKQGPLLETKDAFSKMRPKVSVLQAKLEQLKKRVEECGRDHAKREEVEKRKALEREDQKAVAVVLKAIGEKVETAQTALSNLASVAKPLVDDTPPNLETVTTPLTIQKDAKTASAAVEAEVTVSREAFKAQEERLAGATKGPWSEAKKDIAKLKDQVAGIEKKAAAIITGIQTACEEIGKTKLGQVCSTLRAAILAESKTIDAVYTELVGTSGDHVAEEKFMKLDSVAKLGLSPEQRELFWAQACTSPNGISRRSFFQMLERFCKCVKEVAVTSEFDINVGEIVRKLEIGEFVEVLEGPRTDIQGETQIPRIRGKAMTDGVIGWMTMKGNQGTAYLEDALKPCFFAVEAVAMQDGFESEGTNELRPLKPLEVIEVLEGPRKEVVGSAKRVKGKASDGVVGWFTIMSKQGAELAKPGKSTWTTTSAIALTDNLDIKDCKVLRKLAKGEVLSVVEGPVEDAVSGVVRIKIVAKKDGKTGWMTTRGNAGTTYAAETGRSYAICKPTPLQASFSSDSGTTRMLAEEEELEVLEGPTDERGEPPSRVKGRCLNDGAVGWVTLKANNLKPWKPMYRCVSGTGIGDALEVSNAESIRKLEPGEKLEVIEGPRIDTEVGVVRVKGRATSDGAVGWVTLAGNQGTKFLEVSD